MANSTTGSPWKLDTEGVVTTNPVHVLRMEFIPNAADDDLVVQDNGSNEVWEVTNALAGGLAGRRVFDTPTIVNGFNLSTLGTSCILKVWVK